MALTDPAIPAPGESVAAPSAAFALVRVLRPCGPATWLVTDQHGEVWAVEPADGAQRWRLCEADAGRWMRMADVGGRT